jgi:hypothetical protein
MTSPSSGDLLFILFLAVPVELEEGQLERYLGRKWVLVY